MNSKSFELLSRLRDFYRDSGPERLGVIKEDEIRELSNGHSQPELGGMLSDEDMLLLIDADATWHTHPGASSNTSMEDYDSFMAWPNLLHYIVGLDGISIYTIQNGALVVDLCPLKE